MDFKELKKKRGEMAQNFEKMREEQESRQNKKDDSIYFPKIDANGNANCVIRILPQKDINKHPVQSVRSHRSEVNGKKLWLLCPSTFGTMKDCELCQIAGAEYKRQKDNGEQFPKVAEYRHTTQIVNILVVKDKAQPEMVGKVKKMYLADGLVKLIDKKLFPPKDEDGALIRQPEMIHDLWEGKNLNIVISKGKNGYSDYSDCGFEAENSPVAKTEAEIEAIYNQLYDLEPDRSKLFTNEQILEKWNTFHAINHGQTLDEKAQKVKEEEKKRVEEKKKEKEEEKKAEDSFSNEKVEISSNHEEKVDDSDDVPW